MGLVPFSLFLLLLVPLAAPFEWRNGREPQEDDIFKVYRTFSDLSVEVAKLQAEATAFQFADLQLEAPVIYERVFDNLALLGISEAVIDVTRQLALEGKRLTGLMLAVVDGGCQSFEARILNTNDDLRAGRFEEVPGDYIDFYERDAPIQNAIEALTPIANATLNFLEEAALSAIAEMDGPLVIAINGDLQRGRMLIEDSMAALARTKVFYDVACEASMDALYVIVQQIELLHQNGRKYYINKLH